MTPENRLQARLRFERFTFIAFATVLCVVALAGVVEFKRQQTSLLDSCASVADLRKENDSATRRLKDLHDSRETDVTALRSQLAEARANDLTRGRELGLALTRLALADADGDDAARQRARVSLDYPEYLQFAPRYAPLARWALANAHSLAREYGYRSPAPPIECAGITPSGDAFAVARQDGGIEAYRVSDPRTYRVLEPARNHDLPTCIALGDDLQLLAGLRSGALTYQRLGADGAAAQTVTVFNKPVRVLGLSPSGERLVAADNGGSLRVFGPMPSRTALMDVRLGKRVVAACALDGADYLAAALCADGKLLLLRGEHGDQLELHNFDFSSEPDRAAIMIRGDAIHAAAARGERLEVAVVDLAALLRRRARITHGLGSVSYLGFLADGRLLAAGHTGLAARVHEDDSVQRLPLDFGRRVRLAAAVRDGHLLIGEDGQITLSPDLDLVRHGTRMATRAPGDSVVVSALGFVHGAEGAASLVWPVGARHWQNAGSGKRVLPTWQSWAPAGGVNPVGELIATVQAPPLAIFAELEHERVLVIVSESGSLATLAAPEALAQKPTVAIACGVADVVLLRGGSRLFRLRASRAQIEALQGDAAPGPMAVNADGDVTAYYNGTSVIIDQPGARSRALPMLAPLAMGLMFGGSVLACLEPGALAFYEVENGRCLLRTPTDATDFAARDDELLLVAPGELRVLSLRQ